MERYMIRPSYANTAEPLARQHSMHTHNDCEILLFLDGDASYAVEGTMYRLKHGDIMIMRPSEAHHLVLHSTATYERFVVNFDVALLREFDADGRLWGMFFDRPLGQFNHFRSVLFPENHWRYYLSKIWEYRGSGRELYYLLPLLGELSEQYETVRRTAADISPDKSAEIILYINRHLFEEITLDTICARFYLSKSQLNRIFKKITGSTVWHYITVKRLLYARERLAGGESPTKIYEKCGFRDYISFYKAYRQHFGIAPKEDHQKTKKA